MKSGGQCSACHGVALRRRVIAATKPDIQRKRTQISTAYERLLNAYPARRMKKNGFNHKRKISGDKRSPALLDSVGI